MMQICLEETNQVQMKSKAITTTQVNDETILGNTSYIF